MNCLKSVLNNTLSILMFTFTVSVTQGFAATYYIAATGGLDSNSGLSTTQPWATFSKANSTLVASDTLIVMNGLYQGPTKMINWTKSGTQGKPITIKAANDGQAIIDGQSAGEPLRIVGTDNNNKIAYVTFEGLVLKNSNAVVVYTDFTDHLIFRRISAYNSPLGGNWGIITNWRSTNNTFEDCAVSGTGRKQINNISSQFTTIRRCWVRWIDSTDPGPTGINPSYNSSDTIVENTIITSDGTVPDDFDAWAHWSPSAAANRNKYYGNVIYNAGGSNFASNTHSSDVRIEDNEYINHVIINPGNAAFYQRADANLKIQNCTIVGTPGTILWVDVDPIGKPADFLVAYTMKNCVLLGGAVGIDVESDPTIISHLNVYNDFYNITTKYARAALAGIGEISINPQYNTAKYGKGGYLIRPSVLKGKGEAGSDMGAEVLKRYQNGALTNTPLWPWPMEGRIFNEIGISVTWESQGGLWKTLDGVYSADPLTPAPPSGLKITN